MEVAVAVPGYALLEAAMPQLVHSSFMRNGMGCAFQMVQSSTSTPLLLS